MWRLRLLRRRLLQREPLDLCSRQPHLRLTWVVLLAVAGAISACHATRGSAPGSVHEREPPAVEATGERGGAAPEPEPAAPGARDAKIEDPPHLEGFELLPLPIPGFLDAVVALPRDARPRPLLVATHGAGGDPEWPCQTWAERVHGQRVVLCLRGKALSQRESSGFYYPDHHALGAELLAALDALKTAHAARVSAAPALYVAYSQGASMGALFLVDHGKTFPSLILTEGGHREWSAGSARRFKESGGRRVLFVCGGKGCRDAASVSARLLEKAGVAARVEHVPHGGHTDAGAVGKRLDETFEWALAE
jgi:predicted esterase